MQLLPPNGDKSRSLALIVLIVGPLLLGALALALGQDANWDLRNYHWYNAYAFLNGRYGFDILPSQIPYFYNPLLDVPFYLLATHVSAKMAGFILGVVQGLNFVLLFMISYAVVIVSNTRLKIIICTFLAVLGILGGGGIALIGTTFGDNITSLGVLLSMLLVIRYHTRLLQDIWPKAGLLAFCFGVLPGLMMGLKLPGIIFCIGTCFAFLFAGGTWQRRLVLSFLFGLGILAGVAVALGHWAWYLESQFGNPLFPYFNDTFKSPMLGSINLRDTKFLPHNFLDAVTFPFVFTENPLRVGEIPWRDWRIAMLYVLLPLSLLVRFGLTNRAAGSPLIQPYAGRYLLWMVGLSYLAWMGMFAIYRYAVPIEMLTPLLILCVVAMWPIHNYMRLVITGFLLLIVAASVIPGNWTRRLEWTDHFIETGIPPLGGGSGITSDLMILMAGIEPYSHLIPQFPGDISFVRIQSNFSGPEEDNGTNRMIHSRISAHKGRFMALIPVWNEKDASKAMSLFNLRFAQQPCQKVQDRLYDTSPMELCPVIHE